MDANLSGESVSVEQQLVAGEALCKTATNCTTKYIVYGIGLSTGGTTHPGVHTVQGCCAICVADHGCGAWTYHNGSSTEVEGMGCVTSATALPHGKHNESNHESIQLQQAFTDCMACYSLTDSL
jgi:hypothetical protein